MRKTETGTTASKAVVSSFDSAKSERSENTLLTNVEGITVLDTPSSHSDVATEDLLKGISEKKGTLKSKLNTLKLLDKSVFLYNLFDLFFCSQNLVMKKMQLR
jgi:hypothetical protein